MYRTLLVPVDGSAAALAGLEEAIRIASFCGARLQLVNIVDDTVFGSGSAAPGDAAMEGDLRSMVREAAEKVLRRSRERAEAAGVIASTALVRAGVEGLQALVARQAEESGADLIVLGSHGRRGLSRVFMSNEAEHLLGIVDVPVLLVRSGDVGPDLSVVEISGTD